MNLLWPDQSSTPIRHIQLRNFKYPKRQSSSSLVQDIETTRPKPPPDSYHSYKVSFNPAEYAASFLAYTDFDKIEGTKKSELLDGCRRHAWFVRHKESSKVRVVSNACRLRWCPLCCQAHSNLVEHNVNDWLKDADHPKFMTLTLKHSSAPLKQQIDNLYAFFQRFRKLKEIKKTLTGGMWFFQVKKSEKDDLWHPHLHCLVSGRYIPHSLLSKLWLRTTLSSKVVDIRSVKDHEDAAQEVARYCARPGSLQELGQFDVLELMYAFHGRRLCGTWGTGKSIQLNMISEPDKSSWQFLGNWNVVINSLKDNENARKIFNAWKNGTELAKDISMNDIEAFLNGYETFMTDQQKIPEPERTFWSESVELKAKNYGAKNV
jgi:hypothetical protein